MACPTDYLKRSVSGSSNVGVRVVVEGVALRLRDAAATLATTPLMTDLRWSPCGRRGVALRLRDAAATLATTSRSADLRRWRVRPVTKRSRVMR